MITNWERLAKQLGSLLDDGSEVGGSDFAQQTFDEILGDEWIEDAVEHIVSNKRGGELAMNCLRLIHSTKATTYAYRVYKTSNGVRAAQAVWLIKQLANPISLDWVEEFLDDKNAINWGVGVLDQLLWCEQIKYDNRVKSLLELADKNSNGELREYTDFIRQFMDERNSAEEYPCSDKDFPCSDY